MKEEQARALFLLAGIEVRKLHELPNDGDWRENDTRGGWWLAETPHGTIHIGGRRGVIHINWGGTALRYVITDDDVTKDGANVRASSYAKALEYLCALGDELRRAEAAAGMRP